jgi:hypothetical protein
VDKCAIRSLLLRIIHAIHPHEHRTECRHAETYKCAEEIRAGDSSE